MELITLIDNLVYGEGLVAEHGLSFLIKHKNKKILFDTGQTGAIVKNAGYLAEDLSEVDAVVISHGHYDHCGGLEAFLEINHTATVYMKPNALSEKFSVNSKETRSIGFNLKQSIEMYPNQFIFVEEDMEIFKGIRLIASIDCYSKELVDNDNFFIKEDQSMIHDPFSDELFMLISEAKNLVLLTGCSHKGILNILKTAYEKSNHQNINVVAGGMHFSGELLRHLDQYLIQFNHFGIDKFLVNHCTGVDGYMRLRLKYPLKVSYAYTGFQYEL